MSEQFEEIKQFVLNAVNAQKAVDKIIEEHNLEQAAKKAAKTGERKDLQEYLKMRRERG